MTAMHTSDISELDTQHLTACIELAAQARERGDAPFGARLVSASGEVMHEDSNRTITARDPMAHPEFTLARWAIDEVDDEVRSGSTLYTSAEPCALCFSANFYAGISRIVFAVAGAQLRPLRGERTPAIGMPTRELAAVTIGRSITVDGPDPALADAGVAVHRGYW
ncbi:MAG: nucleoside deaminase [Protaetiibacter sp.]